MEALLPSLCIAALSLRIFFLAELLLAKIKATAAKGASPYRLSKVEEAVEKAADSSSSSSKLACHVAAGSAPAADTELRRRRSIAAGKRERYLLLFV